MLYVTNVRYFMLPTPATIGAKVRTIGTKRASTIVFGPCVEEGVRLDDVGRVEQPALGRWNSDGPTLRPNM